jgi:predicted transposase YbfD/YdcC
MRVGESHVSKGLALAMGAIVDSEGFAVDSEAPMIFDEAFADVPDPRDFNSRHELLDVLFVALAAVLCGATQCTEMALFAKARLDLLRQFVPLKNGAPSHDTFSRVLRILDPAAFHTGFMRFMTAFGQQLRIDVSPKRVAIDGKSLRRAYKKGAAHMPPLVVTAFECETFLSLSEIVAETGGEAEAALKAIRYLSLEGAIVTGDALHCHRRMTAAIREKGGDYILAVKANQSKLHREVIAALDAAAANPKTRFHQTEEDGHGRHDVRRAFIIPFQQSPGKNALVDLVAVARVETWRTENGKTVYKQRHYALSLLLPVEEVLAFVRGHWAIENNLHWNLDVLIREDYSRSRKDNGPANLAILRRTALNVLHADPRKIPLTHKRLGARWEDQQLLGLIAHVR